MDFGQGQGAWALDVTGVLHHVDVAGFVQMTEETFALLSCGADGVLWAMASDQSEYLLYSLDHGAHWERVKAPVENTRQLAGTPWGSCLVVTTNHSTLLVEKDGTCGVVFREGEVDRISCSPDGYLWAISKDSKPGGGQLIKYCHHTQLTLQPLAGLPTGVAIASGPDGGACAVTLGGEVLSIPMYQMAGLETKGGEAFAADISIGRDGTLWAISAESTPQQLAHHLKYWHPQKDDFLAWHTVPDLEVRAVAGAW
ncbi:MAG: hypothetical protein AAGA85_25640 [Bacteroidota bacterium]